MKKILSLALPLIISQLIAMALVVTDIWLMSRISMDTLAAGGLGATVYSFVCMIAMAIVGCVANLIAIAYGQSVSRAEYGLLQIRLALKGAVMLCFVLTIVFMLSFELAPFLLARAQQPEEIISISMRYLDALKWALLPTLLLLVLRSLTTTFGDVRSVMYMSVITVLLNVPVSYLLAFVCDWGVYGLGAGTSISAFAVLLGYTRWVFKRPIYYRFAPWLKIEEYSFRLMTPILNLGLPIAIACILENGLIYGGTLMAGMISVASLALHQILLQCLSFTWNINVGFAQASSILVGKDFGNNNIEGIKHTSLLSFKMVTFLSVLLAAMFAYWPEFIASIFQLNDGQGTNLSVMLSSLIWIVALCFIVDAWQLLAINLLRGMKIVIAPTIATAVGYWLIGLPAAWIMMTHFGLAGIWGGIGIGLGATGLLLLAQLVLSLKPNHNKLINTGVTV